VIIAGKGLMKKSIMKQADHWNGILAITIRTDDRL
jgi:hypothetical protein